MTEEKPQSLFMTKKSLGQHWLTDEASLNAIVSAANLKNHETVLEIGPGTGTLTEKLLGKGAGVIAVEQDESLTKSLQEKFKNNQLQLEQGDIRVFDLANLPPDYKVVANIPYYLTANLLRKLTETSNKPLRAVLLVQKEVSQRITAKPGQMSLLGVAVQLFYQARAGEVVPAKLFTPVPKVDSQILILDRREKALFPVDPKDFFKIVKAGFSARRKKLRSSLSGGLGITKSEAEHYLQQAGLDPHQRAQSLSLENWHKLYLAINPK
jgi:16S rRNA (adenine1518-N6/adenine1519-N6)-dimethyltransferase